MFCWVFSGGCTPQTPAHDCPGHAKGGRAEYRSMKHDGWACRRGLPVPAPIALGKGTGGGRQAPRQGLLAFPEPSGSRCEETRERIAKVASARGLHPVGADCPGHARRGRAEHLAMIKSRGSRLTWLSCPCPNRNRRGTGWQPAPRQRRTCSPGHHAMTRRAESSAYRVRPSSLFP
ncbi:hypothetical protein Metli_1198 [Methanofollis liminatans DSM 4140]|uniref:Uncharacterized protein n=1 Tax=Methanofollis liminatans DSM 4140 TaxID=28892 RepID=J0S968_9EURY|nr:hypothetical protein Metli_1198 [Methanofollis liminatans DSM 4140]